MAGIERSSSSTSSSRSTQRESSASRNEASRNVRSEQSQADKAAQKAQSSTATGYQVRDGWDDTRTSSAPRSGRTTEVQAPGTLRQGPNIDWDFIAQQEGRAVQDGYVPNPEGSQSGVTVATGVDLGARDMDDLNRLGLSDALKEKLEPYLGLRQQEAVDFLEENPLRLTAAEVQELDRAVKTQTLDQLVSGYNAEVAERNAADGGNRQTFEELPQEMQTVIASVHFQYGSLETATPNFFNQVIDQQWDDALANLRDFGDSYSSRRNREADLLARGIASQG